MRQIIILAFLFCGACATQKKAANRQIASDSSIDIGGVSVTSAQLRQLEAALPRTEQDRVFYHWTKPEVAMRWTFQNGMDKGEMAFLNTPTGDRQAAGPGFYFASSATSSMEFGVAAVAVTIPKGTLIFDAAITQKILGHSLTGNQASALGAHTKMIRNTTGDWWLTNNTDNISKIQFGGVNNVWMQNGAHFKSTLSFYRFLWDGIRRNSSGHWAESFLHLLHYQDGISLIRAMEVQPANPWNEFEPENFEAYRRTRQKIIARSIIHHNPDYKNRLLGNDYSVIDNIKGELAQPNMMISYDSYFGAKGMTKEQWAEHQVDKVLPEIAASVRGMREMTFSDMARKTVVRGGGTEAGDTFAMPIAQLHQLLSNPYLEVKYKVAQDSKTALVEYHYPSVFHYRGLKGRITDDLYRTLQETNPDHLKANPERAAELNQRLIRELLLDLFRRYHGKSVSYLTDSGVEFYRDLISIHPQSNYNGRTIRLYWEASQLQSALEFPHHFLADLDILVSKQKYGEILRRGAELEQNFRKAVIQELLLAASLGRAPDYAKLPALPALWQALEPLGLEKIPKLLGNDLELISMRRFSQLFDKVIGSDWPNTDVASLLSLFGSRLPDKVMVAAIRSFTQTLAKMSESDVVALLNREVRSESVPDKHLLFLFEVGSDTVKQAIVNFLGAKSELDLNSKRIRRILSEAGRRQIYFNTAFAAIPQLLLAQNVPEIMRFAQSSTENAFAKNGYGSSSNSSLQALVGQIVQSKIIDVKFTLGLLQKALDANSKTVDAGRAAIIGALIRGLIQHPQANNQKQVYELMAGLGGWFASYCRPIEMIDYIVNTEIEGWNEASRRQTVLRMVESFLERTGYGYSNANLVSESIRHLHAKKIADSDWLFAVFKKATAVNQVTSDQDRLRQITEILQLLRTDLAFMTRRDVFEYFAANQAKTWLFCMGFSAESLDYLFNAKVEGMDPKLQRSSMLTTLEAFIENSGYAERNTSAVNNIFQYLVDRKYVDQTWLFKQFGQAVRINANKSDRDRNDLIRWFMNKAEGSGWAMDREYYNFVTAQNAAILFYYKGINDSVLNYMFEAKIPDLDPNQQKAAALLTVEQYFVKSRYGVDNPSNLSNMITYVTSKNLVDGEWMFKQMQAAAEMNAAGADRDRNHLIQRMASYLRSDQKFGSSLRLYDYMTARDAGFLFYYSGVNSNSLDYLFAAKIDGLDPSVRKRGALQAVEAYIQKNAYAETNTEAVRQIISYLVANKIVASDWLFQQLQEAVQLNAKKSDRDRTDLIRVLLTYLRQDKVFINSRKAWDYLMANNSAILFYYGSISNETLDYLFKSRIDGLSVTESTTQALQSLSFKLKAEGFGADGNNSASILHYVLQNLRDNQGWIENVAREAIEANLRSHDRDRKAIIDWLVRQIVSVECNYEFAQWITSDPSRLSYLAPDQQAQVRQRVSMGPGLRCRQIFR